MAFTKCSYYANRTKRREFKPKDAARILLRVCASSDEAEMEAAFKDNRQIKECLGKFFFDCDRIATAYTASQELFDIGTLVSKLVVILVAILAFITKLPLGKLFSLKVAKAIASLLGAGALIENLIKSSETLREVLEEMAQACNVNTTKVEPSGIRSVINALEEIEELLTSEIFGAEPEKPD